jgi:hypothetical protein
VYAFSTENWKRDPAEVSTLMRIFCKYADEMRRQAGEQGVRVRFLSTVSQPVSCWSVSRMGMASHDMMAMCPRLLPVALCLV